MAIVSGHTSITDATTGFCFPLQRQQPGLRGGTHFTQGFRRGGICRFRQKTGNL
jgi:hypothetical protein